jgi:DNA-binding phage protein
VRSDSGHRGSSFDEFLKEEGLYEVAELLEEGMSRENLSKPMMAKRMGTSRSQLDRVLDPGNTKVQLDTLIKAARAVGRELRIGFGSRLRGEVAAGRGRR